MEAKHGGDRTGWTAGVTERESNPGSAITRTEAELSQVMPLLYPDLNEAALLVTDLDDRLRDEVSPEHGCFVTTFSAKGEQLGPTWEHLPLVGETTNFARDFIGKTELAALPPDDVSVRSP